MGKPPVKPKPLQTGPQTVFQKVRSKIDGSSVVIGALGVVVIASIAGPVIAKRVHWVDPVFGKAGDLKDNSGLQLKD